MRLPKKQVGQNIPFCVFSHRPSGAVLATPVKKGIDRSIAWHRPLKMASNVYEREISVVWHKVFFSKKLHILKSFGTFTTKPPAMTAYESTLNDCNQKMKQNYHFYLVDSFDKHGHQGFVPAVQGPFLEWSEKFFHPKSHSKISNVMITELYYLQILNSIHHIMTKSSLHTRSFRHTRLSVFRYRLTTTGPAGLKSFQGLQETGSRAKFYISKCTVVKKAQVSVKWNSYKNKDFLWCNNNFTVSVHCNIKPKSDMHYKSG